MLSSPLAVTRLPELARSRFRARVSGDPTGAPEWVRDIARVGEGPGWFAPDGVVWRVHGDLATLAGGVSALLGQGAHPLALAGVQRHSAYQLDPWARLAGTARWLVVSTFGSAELAEREAARVRGLHTRVRGEDEHGRAYAASDPALLRWVHLAFTDAFLTAHQHLGCDLTPRFGVRWADAYVGQWQRSAAALGATDLPTTAAELAEALAALEPDLEPVPDAPAQLPQGTARAEPARAAVLRRAGPQCRAAAVALDRPAGRRPRPRRPHGAGPGRAGPDPHPAARPAPGARRLQPVGGGRPPPPRHRARAVVEQRPGLRPVDSRAVLSEGLATVLP